ncbi:MAG: OstA-like protein, partial [Bacteroidota bacterium]
MNLLANVTIAQVDTSTTSESSAAIKIIRSDSTEILQIDGQQITKLKGNVKLYQDSVFMACDSAIVVDRTQLFAYDSVSIQQGDSLVAYAEYLEYDGETRKAYLEEDVVLVSGDQQLFTQRLDYDLNTKVASYYFGATLVTDSTQLTSRRGYYYVDEEEAFFKDSVQVNDPKFYLKADTLKFNTASQTVYFLGPTLITADTSDIYCEQGFYDTQNGLAEFSQNAQYQKDDRQAVADKIRFEDARRLYILAGNAQVRDSARYAEADTIRYFEQT